MSINSWPTSGSDDMVVRSCRIVLMEVFEFFVYDRVSGGKKTYFKNDFHIHNKVG